MKSNVFFVKASVSEGEERISEKARRLFREGQFSQCFKANDFTAIKIHVGDSANNTYVKSACLKGLVEELIALETKPFFTDTSTLYTGRRHNAIDHAVLASEHGFDAGSNGGT